MKWIPLIFLLQRNVLLGNFGFWKLFSHAPNTTPSHPPIATGYLQHKWPPLAGQCAQPRCKKCSRMALGPHKESNVFAAGSGLPIRRTHRGPTLQSTGPIRSSANKQPQGTCVHAATGQSCLLRHEGHLLGRRLKCCGWLVFFQKKRNELQQHSVLPVLLFSSFSCACATTETGLHNFTAQ